VGHIERRERTRRLAAALAQEPEQHVLGADVAVAKGARLLVGEAQRLARAR